MNRRALLTSAGGSLSLAAFNLDLVSPPARAVEARVPVGLSIAAFDRHLAAAPGVVALAGKTDSGTASAVRAFRPVGARGKLVVTAILAEECWVHQITADARGFETSAFLRHMATMPFERATPATAREWTGQCLSAGLERWPGVSRYDLDLNDVAYSLRGSFNSNGVRATLTIRAIGGVATQPATTEAVRCE